MKKIKKFFASLIIAATLVNTTPAPQAQAGIILVPVLIGIVFLVIGIENNDVLLIVLDADGNLPQDALEQNLSKKYSFIEDRDVVRNLATIIREKAKVTPVVNGQRLVTLAPTDVLTVLEPTGLAVLQPELVSGLIKDLQ